jgi:hypothetical protein
MLGQAAARRSKAEQAAEFRSRLQNSAEQAEAG